jgi:hypothetical protein
MGSSQRHWNYTENVVQLIARQLKFVENEPTPVAAKDEIYLGNTTNRGTRIWKFSVIE